MKQTAEKYLQSIGFNPSQLPDMFNDDDKSTYTITELMESYALDFQAKHEEELKQAVEKFVYFLKAEGIVIEEEHKPQDFEFLYGVWNGENPDGLL